LGTFCLLVHDKQVERSLKQKQKQEHGLVTYCPPKSCIPNKANTTMKRNSRNRRLMMDFIELSRDTTRLRKEFQYLQKHAIITTALIQPHKDLLLMYINYAFSTLIQRQLFHFNQKIISFLSNFLD